MTSSAAADRHAVPYIAFAEEREAQDEAIGGMEG